MTDMNALEARFDRILKEYIEAGNKSKRYRRKGELWFRKMTELDELLIGLAREIREEGKAAGETPERTEQRIQGIY